jgi:excisionase family DNA binding protein
MMYTSIESRSSRGSGSGRELAEPGPDGRGRVERLLTTREVAQMLRVSVRFVQLLASRGSLPAIRVGRLWRFRRTDVEAFLAACSGSV